MLYDQKNNNKNYLVTILKGIYRTIKYKTKVHIDKFKKSKISNSSNGWSPYNA